MKKNVHLAQILKEIRGVKGSPVHSSGSGPQILDPCTATMVGPIGLKLCMCSFLCTCRCTKLGKIWHGHGFGQVDFTWKCLLWLVTEPFKHKSTFWERKPVKSLDMPNPMLITQCTKQPGCTKEPQLRSESCAIWNKNSGHTQLSFKKNIPKIDRFHQVVWTPWEHKLVKYCPSDQKKMITLVQPNEQTQP